MKQLVCEMCGGTDIIKQDGVFVCQNCGLKYSVEEARKLMIEGKVEVVGAVQIDKTNEISNLMTIAKRSRDEGNYSDAADAFTKVLAIDPENWEANLYRGYCNMMCSRVGNMITNFQIFCNVIASTALMANKIEDSEELLNAHKTIISEMYVITHVVVDNIYSSYKSRKVEKSIDRHDYAFELKHRGKIFMDFLERLHALANLIIKSRVIFYGATFYKKEDTKGLYELALLVERLTKELVDEIVLPQLSVPKINDYYSEEAEKLFKNLNKELSNAFEKIQNGYLSFLDKATTHTKEIRDIICLNDLVKKAEEEQQSQKEPDAIHEKPTQLKNEIKANTNDISDNPVKETNDYDNVNDNRKRYIYDVEVSYELFCEIDKCCKEGRTQSAVELVADNTGISLIDSRTWVNFYYNTYYNNYLTKTVDTASEIDNDYSESDSISINNGNHNKTYIGNIEIPEALLDRIDELLISGSELSAIKLLKDETGSSLIEAKEWVSNYEKNNSKKYQHTEENSEEITQDDTEEILPKGCLTLIVVVLVVFFLIGLFY